MKNKQKVEKEGGGNVLALNTLKHGFLQNFRRRFETRLLEGWRAVHHSVTDERMVTNTWCHENGHQAQTARIPKLIMYTLKTLFKSFKV